MAEPLNPAVVAADAVAGAEPIAVPTVSGLVDGVAATLLRGSAMARASVTLSTDMVRIALGKSDLRPEGHDWRFKDPTWDENPVYRRAGARSTWRPAAPSTRCWRRSSDPAIGVAPSAPGSSWASSPAPSHRPTPCSATRLR